MKQNIKKYLTDIKLNLLEYQKMPNSQVLEQYDFKALDIDNKTVNGSILFNFNQIDIHFITKSGIKHLYSCIIKHSSVYDCVIQNTHSILEDGNQKVIDKMIRENVQKEEYFNFPDLVEDNHKAKVLALY